MTPERTAELCAIYRDGLLDDTIPFWFPRCIDAEHGGFFGSFDADGTLVDSDKSVWQQGRKTWMLATLYNTVEARPEWLEWAKSGAEFLESHCFDDDGRMFFHVTQDGRPIRKRRYIFSETFACIAFAALSKATGDARLAERATELFEVIVRHYDDPSLFDPKFTDTRPGKGLGLPMILMVTAQVMRENLGTDVDALIDRIVDEVRRDFINHEYQCVMETVGPSGELIDHFDGRTLNPGHAMECAWFILHEAKHRGGDTQLLALGTKMLDWMWEIGWDKEHGGILYFKDVKGLPVQEYWHDMKFWWPQNETIIATLLAHQLTGDAKYEQWHRQVHDWAYAHFPDKENGEWYGYLHRDGRISSTLKGNLWKGFFHFPRMQWYCWQLLK
ncbi:MAG: N-acylglucosamine 2-epimerase [Verrucomicrobiales bacterium]|jgi:N-acylglucosamine 2-epimerase